MHINFEIKYLRISHAAAQRRSKKISNNDSASREPLVRRLCVMFFGIYLFITVFAHAQNIENSQRDTLMFGTDAEIALLIQTLRNENADYLDDDLIVLADTTRNQRILSGIFAFFGDREKTGLEDRAVRAIVERYDEANETVHSAIDYLGKIKYAPSAPVIMELLDSEERRFYSTAFRALGRVSSADSSDETAEFLIDFYNYRNPGDDNRREIITAIGSAGSSLGIPLLVDIASAAHERIPLRIAALDALSKIGAVLNEDNSECLDAILSCVYTDDPNVRSAAVAALGPFSGEAVEKAILDAFRDSFYQTRIAAAYASRDRRFEEAVPYLRYRAERDDVPNVKDEAIRALGAIANEQAITVLESLFAERKNSDRVRILAGEMLMKNAADSNLDRLIVELDDAKTKNQTALYNGLLKVLGETVVDGNITDMENITRRFLMNGGIIEKSYGLDMAVNNNLTMLSDQIIAVTSDRNESLANKARRTAERLGIEL